MLDTTNITTEALEDYDAMMVECAVTMEKFAPLATSIWSDVLKELDLRGSVQLVSGSYDDVGNALIMRTRDQSDSAPPSPPRPR